MQNKPKKAAGWNLVEADSLNPPHHGPTGPMRKPSRIFFYFFSIFGNFGHISWKIDSDKFWISRNSASKSRTLIFFLKPWDDDFSRLVLERLEPILKNCETISPKPASRNRVKAMLFARETTSAIETFFGPRQKESSAKLHWSKEVSKGTPRLGGQSCTRADWFDANNIWTRICPPFENDDIVILYIYI